MVEDGARAENTAASRETSSNPSKRTLERRRKQHGGRPVLSLAARLSTSRSRSIAPATQTSARRSSIETAHRGRSADSGQASHSRRASPAFVTRRASRRWRCQSRNARPAGRSSRSSARPLAGRARGDERGQCAGTTLTSFRVATCISGRTHGALPQRRVLGAVWLSQRHPAARPRRQRPRICHIVTNCAVS
jgi:hypothetical protein